MPHDLIPTEETIAAMREARHGHLESFDSVEALMADLNSERPGDLFGEVPGPFTVQGLHQKPK